MTAHNETRYVCDCCGTEEIVPMDGSSPPHQRMAGPLTWTMIRIGPDPALPPRHLCGRCSEQFTSWMATGKNEDGPKTN